MPQADRVTCLRGLRECFVSDQLMSRDPPRILVVGTGSGGGIGRFEQLLMASLHDLDRRRTFQVDSIWRRSHPAYLKRLAGSASPESSQTSMPIFVATIAAAVVHHRPDLVLFTHVNLARAAPVARVLGVRRYAISVYGGEVWSPLSSLRRHAVLGASQILTVSDHTAAQLERQVSLAPGRMRRIPLAVEPRWAEAARDSEPAAEASWDPGSARRLLSVSRLVPADRYKGIDDVIRALPEVRAALPGVVYHVVGDGEDRAYLESVASRSGVGDAVIFRGLLSHDDLMAEYQQADVFVLPSRGEGFGLVFLEAMVYAKPVIARRAAAAVEVIADGETGVLVDDERGLPAAMISLLVEPDRALAMGLAGRRRAREVYSFERFTSRVEAALHTVLA